MVQLTNKPSPGRITHPFGAPPATPTSPSFHMGTDFGWGNGREIYAAASGRVKSYGYVGAYGNRIVIDHGSGVETWYCHLASANVVVNQWVVGGQRIATMGATGNVTAMHLHFEYRLHGVPYDPMTKFTSQAGGGATPITPNTEDYEMRYIWAPNRGGALVGELGYYPYTDTEYAQTAFDVFGGITVSDRQFDVARQDAINRGVNKVAEIASTVASTVVVPSVKQITDAVVAALPKGGTGGDATETGISAIVTAAIKAAFARAAE